MIGFMLQRNLQNHFQLPFYHPAKIPKQLGFIMTVKRLYPKLILTAAAAKKATANAHNFAKLSVDACAVVNVFRCLALLIL